MNSSEIRQRYLKFFEKRGHTIIPSASLVPENDPSSLFTTAGMQPLVPYLLGAKHPAGTRLVDVQKCIRTGDIDDVGDNRHLTFFEMLGNWSLGDYFKKEAIEWSLEFLTNKEEGLGLDINRLYVTTFKGEDGIPRDEDSIKFWKENFSKHKIEAGVSDDGVIKDNIKIILLGKEDNFWIAGSTGPCGGDTEMFYDVVGGKLEGNFQDLVKSGRIIEIWNNVFMEFNKTSGGTYEPLAKPNVDTGMGLERTSVVMQGKDNVFETDIFEEVLSEIKKLAQNYNEKSARIIADHVRAATFMISDGVIPGNTEQAYVLRRLLRRAVRAVSQLGLVHENKTDRTDLSYISEIFVRQNMSAYPNLAKESDKIFKEIEIEEEKFRKTLANGLKEFQKGIDAFDLFQSYGFPIELTVELAKEKGVTIDMKEFNEKMEKHQAVSKAGAEQKFKGGLAGTGEQETKYHTATHLLNAALRAVLGEHVSQKGSNITAERMRFDFSHRDKLTDEQKRKVEEYVNGVIALKVPVTCTEMKVGEAKETGAIGVFTDKYDDVVKVYTVGDEGDHYSKEICGGPHVQNTEELGRFKILKEEAVSAGVRRIKAVLE